MCRPGIRRRHRWHLETTGLLTRPQRVRGAPQWLAASVVPASPGSLSERASPLLPDQIDVLGHFEVCPVTLSKPKVMQMVCMAHAWNVTAKPNGNTYKVP